MGSGLREDLVLLLLVSQDDNLNDPGSDLKLFLFTHAVSWEAPGLHSQSVAEPRNRVRM